MAAAVLRYFEGGNRLAIFIVPPCFGASLFFYSNIASRFAKLSIDTQITYSYVFNLFAVEFGALVSLFALLACRPTKYLERIRNTNAFRRLIANLKTTLMVTASAILYTFILAVIKLEPAVQLELRSVVFVGWLAFSAAATLFYCRAVRLTFIALT